MEINLVFGYQNPAGGALSVAVHLGKILNRYGQHTSRIFCYGKNNRRKDINGIQVIQSTDIVQYAERGKSLIVHVYANTSDGRYDRVNSELFASRVPIVFHDHLGLFNIPAGVSGCAYRKPVVELAAAEQDISLKLVTFPYVTESQYLGGIQRSSWAICHTRVAPEKHIELILEANRLLPEEKRCKLFANSVNMRYVNFVLRKSFPEWKENYIKRDKSPEILSVLASYRYCVDMSILGYADMGGPQYAFLESLEAGCQLIVHRDWVSGGNPGMRDGVNCLAVSDASELARILIQEPSGMMSQPTEQKFYEHCSKQVYDEWMDVIAG